MTIKSATRILFKIDKFTLLGILCLVGFGVCVLLYQIGTTTFDETVKLILVYQTLIISVFGILIKQDKNGNSKEDKSVECPDEGQAKSTSPVGSPPSENR